MKAFDSWFERPGAYVLVDGQFGSTGKGLLAAAMAIAGAGRINMVTSNAGPNSGHTAYFDGEQILTRQLPVASVVLERMGHPVRTYLNAGAVIAPEVLSEEIQKFGVEPVRIHPCAAVIGDVDVENDQITVNKIASTGKGVGPAIIRKISRQIPEDPALRVAGQSSLFRYASGREYGRYEILATCWNWDRDVVLVETAQGFSLGINSPLFYPHTTSRECTVMQAIADARIPAQVVRKVAATYRTYPIRVGNTQGSSGDHYPDQRELTWEEVGQTPELTTVTKRMRRVFTWSRQQFRESVAANRPDVIFLNFCNYMDGTPERRQKLVDIVRHIFEDYQTVMGRALQPNDLLLGWGPYVDDITSGEDIECLI